MSSERYFQSGPQRAQRVRALFDRIAPRYDLINDLQSFGMHRLWKRRLIALAKPEEGFRALDVCCGTGDLTLSLADKCALAVGCDFSPLMLSVARRRATSVPFIQADALALPVGSNAFEIVTIGYGLRNLADLRKGIAELIRVTKPGGQLLILDFGKPRNRLWRAVYFSYLRIVVPLFGLIFCADAAAYSYILESLLHYPAQDGVSELLKEAGCDAIEVQNLVGGVMSIHRVRKARSLGEGHDVALVARDVVRER